MASRRQDNSVVVSNAANAHPQFAAYVYAHAQRTDSERLARDSSLELVAVDVHAHWRGLHLARSLARCVDSHFKTRNGYVFVCGLVFWCRPLAFPYFLLVQNPKQQHVLPHHFAIATPGLASMHSSHSLLPLSSRQPRHSFSTPSSSGESHIGNMYTPHSPTQRDDEDTSKTRKANKSPKSCGQRLSKRWFATALVAGLLLGYYAQVLVFFLHVRMGFTGEILPTHEVSRTAKGTASLIEFTKRVIFVCKKTNWDFIGLIATPHTVLFAHSDVYIPPALDETLSVVRHDGVDSYLNLHNKTLTIMSHVHRDDARNHLLKQDEEAVVFWPHYYQCLKKCKDLATCYAGDMHVNIGGASNVNSYVFATGGSYFLGNSLLKCLLDAPVKVELDGLDYGEDKMVGKMIHYNKCAVQYVSCKWFNNREVYSPHAVLKMVKQYSVQIKDDTVLLSQAEQAELANGGGDDTEPGEH